MRDPNRSASAFFYGLFHGLLPQASVALRRRLYGLADLRVVQEMVRRAAVNHTGAAERLNDAAIFAGLADLAGLPPVHLLNADRDLLRASAENFAHRLTLAGVPHEGWYLPGTSHGFLAKPNTAVFDAGTTALTSWLSGRDPGPARRRLDPAHRLAIELAAKLAGVPARTRWSSDMTAPLRCGRARRAVRCSVGGASIPVS